MLHLYGNIEHFLQLTATLMPKAVKEKLTVIIGTAVAQWLRCCATDRKDAGSIPDSVIGIFH